MKTLLIAGVVLLAGCATGYEMQPEMTSFTTTVKIVPTAGIRKACGELGSRIALPTNGGIWYGCAKINVRAKTCNLVLPPMDKDWTNATLNTWGHELAECVYNGIHPIIPKMP